MIRTACSLLLILSGWLLLHNPSLTHWKGGLSDESYILALLVSNLVFALLPLNTVLRLRVGLLLGLSAVFWLESAGPALLLAFLPSAALLVFRATSRAWVRGVFTASVIAVFYFLRFRAGADLITVFMVSSWIKIVSLACTDRSKLPGGTEGHLRTAFYFFAPPFLLGPLPLEWIRFAYFDSRAMAPRADDPRALRMLALGLIFLSLAGNGAHLLSEAITGHFAIFSEDTAWWKQAIWGYSLFLSRYLTLGGLTALSVGIFQLAQIEVKYDFYRPFLARDLLEFWSRYHSYGKEFLYAHVYLPIYFGLPRITPHLARAMVGLVAVFMTVGFVQHMNYIPAPFAAPADYYGLRASFQHSFASLTLLLWTVITRSALLRAVSGKKAWPWAGVAEWLSWLQTQLAIGYFFFGAYWNLWKGLSIERYFLRIFVG